MLLNNRLESRRRRRSSVNIAFFSNFNFFEYFCEFVIFEEIFGFKSGNVNLSGIVAIRANAGFTEDAISLSGSGIVVI